MYCVSCKFPAIHNKEIKGILKDANELTDQNKYQEAFDEYRQAYLIDSSNIPALFGCGFCSYKLEKKQDAINFFTKILLIQTDKMSYHFRGLCYYDLGNDSAAKNDCNSFLRLDSTSIAASNTYFNRGQLEYREQNYMDAIKYYTSSILIDSTSKESYIQRGLCYYNLLVQYIQGGRANEQTEIAQKSMNDFNKTLAIDSSYDMAWNAKGLLLMAMHKSEGIYYVSKAIDIDPTNGLFYKNRAIGYYYLHKTDSFCMDMTIAAQYKQEGAQEYIDKYCGK
jgi:tetratricopeptide (TPR) repeat protein